MKIPRVLFFAGGKESIPLRDTSKVAIIFRYAIKNLSALHSEERKNNY